ncbi:MAG TPA: M1 family metallopeptidase [Edaphobacter sp.]
MQRTPLLAAALFLSSFTNAQSLATNSPNGQPLSTRVVAYNIEAKLDTAQKTLDATETLTYKNLTGQPLSTFPFHLYLNAFRPESTFTRETHFNGGIRDNERDDTYPDEKRGSITISHIDADTFGDLTPTLHFIAPDDNNADDQTVAEITLPHALAPNDSITFHIAFHDKFPLSVARNGYKRDFIMGGQWFPKPGVFWHGAWNCHQYHSTTEFFSDFGTYKVNLTLPRRFVVGASGVPTGETTDANGNKTVSYYGEDIGDFAWAASPNFTVTDGIFLSSLGPVQIHVLALRAHPRAGPRYLSIIQKTMQQFDRRYGPYPYKIVTVIDPEPDSEIGGMEYPTLFTGDTSWFEPTHITEITAMHEFGHQYWYGMVATNEFQDAWLDEGINSYTEVKVLDDILGRNTSILNRSYVNLGDYEVQRLGYISKPDFDPVTRWAFKFRNSQSYGDVAYGKTATLLQTLEGIVGRDTMDEAMRTWFMRYRFTHPTSEDFLRTIEEVAIKNGKALALAGAQPNHASIKPSQDDPNPGGIVSQSFFYVQEKTDGPTPTSPPSIVFPSSPPLTPSGQPDHAVAMPTYSTLRPFFDQAVYGTQILDYAIDDVSSGPLKWWLPEPEDEKERKNLQYLSTVVLHRKGDFILPVTVEIIFEDGTIKREHWDGVDRWTRFTYTLKTKVRSAEIDPDHTALLDKNLFNNSYTTEPRRLPTRKLTNIWLSFTQLLSQLVTWIV